MNIITLKIILKTRGICQSDLAKMAGISRQAVSLWFKSKDDRDHTEINVHSKHLQRLSHALHINVDDLLQPLPCLSDTQSMESFRTSLLWDYLYPSVEDFVIALVHRQPRAVGRLVQVCGFFQAEKLMGHTVWKDFPKYKKFIHPVRRKECEQLWHLQKSLNLN